MKVMHNRHRAKTMICQRTDLIVRLLLVVALTGLAMTGCRQGGAAAPENDQTAAVSPSLYATIASDKVDIEGGVIEVAARRAGVIREVLVQEGDAVKKGQILARQDDQDAVLAVTSAQAAVKHSQSQLALSEVNIRTAQREHDRLRELVHLHLVAQQQLDQAADALATAQAQLGVQQSAVQTAKAQLAQAVYSQDLTIIRAPMDGKIIRRYANPGAGASTLNVSDMFDLEPALPHIVRAEIVESAVPDVYVGQEAEITPEADPAKVSVGHVIRIGATFGARKLKSDSANEAIDERVVEVIVSNDRTSYLIGQRVLVKIMKRGEHADAKRAALVPTSPAR